MPSETLHLLLFTCRCEKTRLSVRQTERAAGENLYYQQRPADVIYQAASCVLYSCFCLVVVLGF